MMFDDGDMVLMEAELEAAAAVHPNPACQSWCATAHGYREFAGSGGIVCSRIIGAGTGWSVAVEGGVWTSAGDLFHPEAPLDALELGVCLTDGHGEPLESLPVHELREAGAALEQAAAFIEGLGQ